MISTNIEARTCEIVPIPPQEAAWERGFMSACGALMTIGFRRWSSLSEFDLLLNPQCVVAVGGALL